MSTIAPALKVDFRDLSRSLVDVCRWKLDRDAMRCRLTSLQTKLRTRYASTSLRTRIDCCIRICCIYDNLASVGRCGKPGNFLGRQSNLAEVRRTVVELSVQVRYWNSHQSHFPPCITSRSRGTTLTGTIGGPITRSPREGSNFDGPSMTSKRSPGMDFRRD